MSDKIHVKIERAKKLTDELLSYVEKNPPFQYVVCTNFNTNRKLTYSKTNQENIDYASAIVGDIAHNLRSSLDHVYWRLVSPHVSEDKHSQIQFPFSRSENGLIKNVVRRCADKVSDDFVNKIISYRPYHEDSGNRNLCLIDSLDIEDKHKDFILLGQYKIIDVKILKEQIKDFPKIISGMFKMSGLAADFCWDVYPIGRREKARMGVPESGILEENLNVPVDVYIDFQDGKEPVDLFYLLRDLIEETELVIKGMHEAAGVSMN